MIRRQAAAAWSGVRDGRIARNERPAARTPISPPTPNPQPLIPRRRAARGFTLVELLITVSIIAIMASMVLFAMYQAQDAARAQKTRTLIAKLDSIIMARYDEYRTRRVPYVFPQLPPNATPAQKRDYATAVARARVDCIRDLMRMEMPDRWSDVLDDPVAPLPHGNPSLPTFNGVIQRPSVSEAYRAKAAAGTPSVENQGAECLYMIVMAAVAQQGDSREVFKPGDIGDVDGDGFPEFLDGWGNPIEFLRWAPGYLSPLQSPIRLSGLIELPGGKEVRVRVTNNEGPRLSQTPGSYVGGAVAFLHPGKEQIDTQLMGRITGYQYDISTNPPTVHFTCSTPGYTSMLPFRGQSANGQFVVLQPDPFDSRGAYPRYPSGASFPPGEPDTSIPTYALYPLIISRGPDRASGIKDGAGGGNPALQYSQEHLNPFYVGPPVNETYGLMLGSIPTQVDGEPNWKPGCHLDNITNHQLNTR